MKRRLLVIVTGVVALVVGLGTGGAYAYWTSGGSGSGAATAGSPQGVTVKAASAAPATMLHPGSTGDLVVEIENPNAYPVTVTGLAQNGAVAAVGGTGPGAACTGASSGVSVATQTGLSVSLPSGSNTLHFPGAVAMATSSASGCQGASFQIPVTVTVQR